MFEVLHGKLKLFEGPDGYKPTEDSFWLSSLLPPLPKGTSALELGCGTGAVVLSYGLRYPSAQLTGLDHDPTMLKAAQKGSATNNIPLNLIEADALTHTASELFDLTFANPPFYKKGREMAAQSSSGQNVKNTLSPKAWLTALLENTKDGGLAVIICHLADAPTLLADAHQCVHYFILKSSPQRGAKRAVLIFKKGVKGPAPEAVTIHTYDKALRKHVLEENKGLFENFA